MIAPRNDYVLVRLLDEEAAVNNGGFGLSRNQEESIRKAIVLMVGPGRLSPENERIPVELYEGQKVILFPTGGQCIDDRNILIKEDLIIGVYEDGF